MKVLIIYSHPWEKSFNHAILNSVVKGLDKAQHKYELFDLNKDRFNPVLKKEELALYSKGKFKDPLVGRYQKIMEKAEYIFFIFPMWWGSLPAILKGFIDKVFLNHWAYETTPMGMLKGKMKWIKGCTIILTMGSRNLFYHLSLKTGITKVFAREVLRTCGIKKIKVIPLGMVDKATNKKRKKWLGEIEDYAKKLK